MGTAELYADNSELRGMIQAVASLVPLVGGVVAGLDIAIVGAVAKARQERLNTLLDELEKGTTRLTRRVIISDPLIYACYTTVEAAIRTQRLEKVRAFTRLLIAGIEDKPRLDLETEHEDYLKILDELSYREICLLAVLEDYEERYPIQETENALQRANRFWSDFSQQVCREYLLEPDELDAWMTRLNRTGTYETFIGMYLDYTGGKGKLTPTYYRLASLIRSTPGRFNTGKRA